MPYRLQPHIEVTELGTSPHRFLAISCDPEKRCPLKARNEIANPAHAITSEIPFGSRSDLPVARRLAAERLPCFARLLAQNRLLE